MNLIIPVCRAYIYSGDWVGDCPGPDCANTEFLMEPEFLRGPRTRPKSFFICSSCGEQAPIDWPDRDFMTAALDVLMRRPVPTTRNWYPKDHDIAIRFRVEHGQSIDDLRAENELHGVTP
jgi:hypothetical protein